MTDLDTVAAARRIWAFYSLGNRLLGLQKVQGWVPSPANCDAIISPDAGQLAAFSHPVFFVPCLRDLVSEQGM